MVNGNFPIWCGLRFFSVQIMHADLVSNEIQCKILKGFETISDCFFVK